MCTRQYVSSPLYAHVLPRRPLRGGRYAHLHAPSAGHRRTCLQAASLDHLCKTIMFENSAGESITADITTSKYILVVVQYTARMSEEKLAAYIVAVSCPDRHACCSAAVSAKCTREQVDEPMRERVRCPDSVPHDGQGTGTAHQRRFGWAQEAFAPGRVGARGVCSVRACGSGEQSGRKRWMWARRRRQARTL